MTRFIVRPPYIGSMPTLSIDEDRYKRILQSYSHLSVIMSIEEKYDILIENYREFELDSLEIALNDELYSDFDIPGIFTLRRSVSRRLANILSSVRLYLDYLGVESDKGLAKWYETIHQKVHDTYDSQGDYRLLEALRNHMQHYGLPINVTKHLGSLEIQEKRYVVCHTSTFLSIKDFIQDREVKRIVKDDLLKTKKEVLELDIPIRNYIEGIFSIHQAIRDLAAGETKESEKEIEDIIAEYIQINEDYGKGVQQPLTLNKWADGERLPSSSKTINNTVILNLNYLRKKNQTLENLSKRIVSSQSVSDLNLMREMLRNTTINSDDH